MPTNTWLRFAFSPPIVYVRMYVACRSMGTRRKEGKQRGRKGRNTIEAPQPSHTCLIPPHLIGPISLRSPTNATTNANSLHSMSAKCGISPFVAPRRTGVFPKVQTRKSKPDAEICAKPVPIVARVYEAVMHGTKKKQESFMSSWT